MIRLIDKRIKGKSQEWRSLSNRAEQGRINECMTAFT
jgi:hypothetical protein